MRVLRAIAAVLLLAVPVGGEAAPARALRVAARAPLPEGFIAGAFALDDRGAQAAYAFTDARGTVSLRIGPPGKRGRDVEIGSFSAAPERVVHAGGSWFAVANDGRRRAAAVGPGGIRGQTGPFSEFLVAGKTFVTTSEKPDKERGGRTIDIAAYGGDGRRTWSKVVAVGPDDRLVGTQGLFLVAFTGGHLHALVRKPGAYERAKDARGLPELAVLDLRTGKVGRGQRVDDIERFSLIATKRAEHPGLEAFVRLEGEGFELVGPGERVRPLRLPTRASLYDQMSLRQQLAGGRIVFTLIVDPLNPDRVAQGKKGPRALHVFTVAVGSGRVSFHGEAPLDDDQDATWAAGGSRLALVRKTADGLGRELVVYAF
jgi:hypothetical protein